MTTMQEVFPVLNWFHREQVKKLRENADKLHWNTLDFSQLDYNLNAELTELAVELSLKNVDAAIKECADVANAAMMIADKLKTCGFDK